MTDKKVWLITGTSRGRAALWAPSAARTSAPPSGCRRVSSRAMILTEGILRARYRTSFTAPEPLEPDAVYEFRLNLWARANVFLPGHRIRLEVSKGRRP